MRLLIWSKHASNGAICGHFVFYTTSTHQTEVKLLIRHNNAKTKLLSTLSLMCPFLWGIMDAKVFQNQTWFIYDPLGAKLCHLFQPDWPLWKCVVYNPPSWLIAHPTVNISLLQKCIFCSTCSWVFKIWNHHKFLDFIRIHQDVNCFYYDISFNLFFCIVPEVYLFAISFWSSRPGTDRNGIL